MIEEHISAKGISQKLGISRSAVFALVKRNILPKGILIGGSRRWAVSEIEEVIAKLKEAEAHE